MNALAGDWVHEIVDDTPGVGPGKFNSIAVDSDGIPVIAFSYQTNSPEIHAFLYLTRRTEPTGISGEEFSGSASSDPVLHPVYPNPVLGAATISFKLEESCSVRLEVFDISGHLVETTLDEDLPQGEHSVLIDGLSTGVYFCRMTTGTSSVTQRFAVLRCRT